MAEPAAGSAGAGGRWAITGARLATGALTDVVVEGDRVVAAGAGLGALAASRADARGGLLLPAFVDTHVHLDKALTRDRLAEHDGTLAGAIRSIQALKREYTVDDVRVRARAVIHSSVIAGTTRLRSHVDVDSLGGLVPLQGVLAAARACSSIAEVQVVAFPQEGLLRDPGAPALMERAMAEGATVVGGMPHWELGEADQRAHVRLCFGLGERFDAPLDLHVDETDDASVRTLEMVADEALARGWHGRVTVGHVCSLAGADSAYAARVIEKCARAGITVVSNPVTNLVLQGRRDRGLVRRGVTRVAEMRAAGVNVAFGQDCVRDGFYPFGRGSMTEVALISAHATHLSTRSELAFALAAVTEAPARSWGLRDYGLRPGDRADLQLYDAPTWEEVLRLQQPPRRVWFRGRPVAETTVTSGLVREP